MTGGKRIKLGNSLKPGTVGAVVDFVSGLPPERSEPAWLEHIRRQADAYMEATPSRPASRRVHLAAILANKAQEAIAAYPESALAVAHALGALQAAWLATMVETRPLVATAEKVVAGRKVGAKGALRRWVDLQLREHPADKGAALWKRAKANPPAGHQVFDKPVPYVLGPKGKNTDYRRFASMVSEARRDLGLTI